MKVELLMAGLVAVAYGMFDWLVNGLVFSQADASGLLEQSLQRVPALTILAAIVWMFLRQQKEQASTTHGLMKDLADRTHEVADNSTEAMIGQTAALTSLSAAISGINQRDA